MPGDNGSLLSAEQKNVIDITKRKIQYIEKIVELSDKTKPEIKKVIEGVKNTKERLALLEQL
jgi:hypothetical protein